MKSVCTALQRKFPHDHGHGHHCASPEGPGPTSLGASAGGELWPENCPEHRTGPGHDQSTVRTEWMLNK